MEEVLLLWYTATGGGGGHRKARKEWNPKTGAAFILIYS